MRVSINAYIMSNQLGLHPIFGISLLVYKKSKQFNHSQIADDIAALMLTLSVNGPFILTESYIIEIWKTSFVSCR